MEGGIPVGILKRFLAGIVSFSLLLSLSGGALAATRAVGFTMGVYVTAGLSGSCYSLDPLTGEETGENYLRYTSAVPALAQENDANLFFDLGNRPEDMPTFAEERIEPIALCLRYGSFFLLPGIWEEALPAESRDQMEGILSGAAGDYPRGDVETLWSAGRRAETDLPFVEYSVGLGLAQFKVCVVRLEEAAQWESAMRDRNDLVIAAAPSGTWSQAELEQLAAQTRFVDLILVGAGTEETPAKLENIIGQDVPVVGGKGAFRVMVSVDRSGSLSVGAGERLELAGYPNDEELEGQLLSSYEAAVQRVSQEIGLLSGPWDQERDLLHVQSDTMNLLHEAQLWATGAEVSLAAPTAAPGFCVGQLLNGGRSGPISLRDCYSICRDGDSRLYVVEMTGTQLKNWIEECVKNYRTDANGVVTGGDGTDQLYGISYDVYLGNPEGRRVLNMTHQGKPVTDRQVFRVAVSASRLSASEEQDEYGWYAVTGITLEEPDTRQMAATLEEAPAVRSGSVPMILAEYIESMTARGEEIAPPQARSRWTISPATSEEALASVSRLDFVEMLYEAAGRPSAYLDLGQSFDDIPGKNSAAAWAVQAGIVIGNGSGQFLPDTLVTREQAAVMLLRYDNARGAGPAGSWGVRVPYTDAAVTASWASEALMWNVIREYLLTDGGGNFNPQKALTVADLQYAISQLGK